MSRGVAYPTQEPFAASKARNGSRVCSMPLTRHDAGCVELAAKLSEMGLAETEGSVTVKINRGAFPAWWLMAVARAVGAHTLQLE